MVLRQAPGTTLLFTTKILSVVFMGVKVSVILREEGRGRKD
jgi:hypothetical protein